MPVQRSRSRKWIYQALLTRDGGCCHYCECYLENEGKRSMTIDHVVPLVAGGDNRLTNMVLACYTCNHKKGDKSYIEFIESEFLKARIASIQGQVIRFGHEAIKFNRSGNWSCLCGQAGKPDLSPKTLPCTLSRYGAFYQP